LIQKLLWLCLMILQFLVLIIMSVIEYQRKYHLFEYFRLWIHFDYGVPKLHKNSIFNFVCFEFILFFSNSLFYFFSVNDGDYLNAVSEQSLAENITRVLYPNDNVRFFTEVKSSCIIFIFSICKEKNYVLNKNIFLSLRHSRILFDDINTRNSARLQQLVMILVHSRIR
jgi:hypothetical protein